MLFDISKTPFSRYGAYISVTAEPEKNILYIHNVRRRFGEDFAYKLKFYKKEIEVACSAGGSPECINIYANDGSAQVYIRDDQTVVIDTVDLDVELVQLSTDGYAQPESNQSFKMISAQQRIYTYIYVQEGEGILSDINQEKEFLHRKQKLTVFNHAGKCTLALKMSIVEPMGIELPISVEDNIASIYQEWKDYRNQLCNLEKHSFEELTWYNLWSSFVRAEDVYRYDIMLMSKKHMCSVWSWDHCFNALAMAKVSKEIALEQFLAPFVLQSDTGALPDLWNPNYEIVWGITKPPIHGWCFSKLMDLYEYDIKVLKDVYGYLVKWTEWWINYRDSDHDGIPEYPQGCDSGWDNSTIFDIGYFMETPDLPAFLVIQMKTLNRIAAKLYEIETGDWGAKAKVWETRAADMLHNLYNHSWNGERFIAKQSGTHIFEENCYSLLNLMPLILGELLDEDKRNKLIKTLKADFLTDYGLASESPKSRKYESDGYWRGPVWAPYTYLIVDGLRRSGETGVAEEIAAKFCHMVSEVAQGNYENFNALTGTGLRAPGYTWTASVYMLLKWELEGK